MKKMSCFAAICSIIRQAPAHETRITVATLFTIARIVLAPMIMMAMVWGYWKTACFLFIGAALTDLIDGFLARHFGQKTLLGACLDPIADKLLLFFCFFSLAFIKTPLFHIPQWFVFAIVVKEVIQVFGGLWLFLFRQGKLIEPTFLGKITTTLQLFFIGWLFTCYFFGWVPLKTYDYFFTLLCFLMGLSFAHYLSLAIKIVRKS